MFIVVVPDATINNASTRNTIFAGISSGNAGDMTGVGFGDYSSRFTNETLSYNQDVPAGGSFNGEAEINTTYSNAGIINIRNDAATPTKQEILYNSNLLSTSTIADVAFANVGYVDTVPDPDVTFGTKYWIGKNYDTQGSLNGRVAEIFTFAERVPDADRQKIESYLAIKYGITLGASTEAQKDYINSFGTKIWDITANSGYNYHVAGIGRDSISDLNQKQSKTLNTLNEVTIGLNGIFTTNSANINEFSEDGDFLVWGSNNAAFTAGGSNTVTIASGITTSVTRVLRQWKIVESTESSSDVENVYVSIPSSAFSSFTLSGDEVYALIVADNDNFANGDIIDVVPLKADGLGNLSTWYDFDGTKYFTFGKASKLSENHSIEFNSGDYLVGEYSLNLNVNDFTISAWVKADATQTTTRTIMAKGSKLQLRLNASHEIEVMVDDDVTPRFTSDMALNDNKWHQISFVYNSGSIFLYVDGVLDKSEQNVAAPSVNYNRFSIGALYIDKNTITNPFLGRIDEVYVWDVGLSQDQVRFLMNQEAEKGTGDFVSSKTIPQASSSNEVSTIAWSKLKAYYDFNSFYGSTVEGLTDAQNFLRIKYLDKNKEVVENQTIPVPYISVANGVWDAASTWQNGTDNVLPNSLSLDGVTTIDWNIVYISHDITSGDRDISVLGLIQTSGNLIIADPNEAQDETNSGQGLTILNYLELDGVIDLVGESQLVQTEGSIVDADSGGYIERDQQGTANSFNYNYWSSSVNLATGNTSTRGTGVSSTNTNVTLAGIINDGTDSSAYQPLTFASSPYAADATTPTSPKTISSYWLYKFYGPTNNYASWTKITQLSALLPGEGFTMKGTSGSALITDLQNYVFKGLPNNGDITLALNKSSGDVDRLVGNPYPSAIDANEFILDNLSIADGGNNTNGTIINGALYFWDHFGEENTHILKGYVGGYATYNLTGGAQAISNDSRINDNLTTGSKIPGQYIPVNQGFFVSTKVEGFTNGDGNPIATVNGGDIVFNNSQRVFVREDGATSLFMKPDNQKSKSSYAQSKPVNKNPIVRLMYDSPLGYHRQLVLGANPKASSGFDMGYDAIMEDVNEEDMYWEFGTGKFVIQGIGNFNETSEFSLGLIVKKEGLAKIRLEGIENFDADINIFVKDESTGEVFNINNQAFEIYLKPGEYAGRFKLLLSENQLAQSDNQETVKDEDYGIAVYYSPITSELLIINKNNIKIKDVSVFDLLGNKVESSAINSSEDASIKMPSNQGIYIVQLNTEKGILGNKTIVYQ
ncbi:T9SS type A sorting domain-containing protein [Flavobacteriaceae bacterium XHP0103]|uniref:LamG-like jellyroll fold domain-containing protein n=1 Tax=Marixanthotalea marina TaxID=2844359 RepID=UPI002989C3A9|nr:LamG-like jellyroll fold domain-containing protein [Marixanthotalea marina]MBU3822014.1 T9SS type A sorting domain-containing protein [Marixanthotalea marina]